MYLGQIILLSVVFSSQRANSPSSPLRDLAQFILMSVVFTSQRVNGASGRRRTPWSNHTFERSFHESEGQLSKVHAACTLVNSYFWALFFRVRGPIHGVRRCSAAWSNHTYEPSFPDWLVRNLGKTFYLQEDRDRVFVGILAILKGAPLRGHLATQIYLAYFRCSHAFCCWLPKSTSYIPSSLM